MEALEKIVLQAKELFLKYGFRSVTMSDISNELGISKKTLYQYVENKEDLINKVILQEVEEEKMIISNISGKAETAVEEMFEISTYINQMLQKTNPSAIYDLRKYYRKAWEIIEAFQNGFVYQMIKKNIERGMEEGLYREDIKPDIITKLYLGMSQLILDPETFPFPEYHQAQLHQVCLNHHLRGLIKPEAIYILSNREKAINSK